VVGASEYFAPTVKKVVDSFMRSHGFSPGSMTESRVAYTRADVIVSFGYYREDLPSPWVAVDVGRLGPDGSVVQVGLWRSIPDSAPERGYTRWQFRNRPGLEEVLTRITSELLPSYGQRLWEDDSLFSRVLAAQDAEVHSSYRAMKDRSTLLAARRAFEDGQYQAAVDQYVLLGTEELTAADLRRLHQAKAKLKSANSRDT
jgi:hypothetical protein